MAEIRAFFQRSLAGVFGINKGVGVGFHIVFRINAVQFVMERVEAGFPFKILEFCFTLRHHQQAGADIVAALGEHKGAVTPKEVVVDDLAAGIFVPREIGV